MDEVYSEGQGDEGGELDKGRTRRRKRLNPDANFDELDAEFNGELFKEDSSDDVMKIIGMGCLDVRMSPGFGP